MSKLAHSHEESMASIAVAQAIADGDEDYVGLARIIFEENPRCEHKTGGTRCFKRARFLTKDKKRICQQHAEQWATKQQLAGA